MTTTTTDRHQTGGGKAPPSDTARRAQTPDGLPNGLPGAPRFATLWASLVYAIGTLSLGWKALAGQFLVGPHSDQYIAGYPFREFAARTLRETGAFPQWNPYQFGGMPYVAAMHGDIFYPTFLLRMIMPTDVAMTWSFVIHLFLAGLFGYLFLRKTGFGFWGALLGGLAYMMSGQLASLVSPGHDGKLYVSALFPLLLWALVSGIRDGKRWAWGATAVIVGLDVLSPHPQLLQYSLLAAGAYAIYLTVRGAKQRVMSQSVAIKRLACALGAVVLGGLIGAVQYLPVRGYVNWSPRAEGIGSYEHATSFGWNPQELFNVYLPQFSGMLDAYWGPNGIHFHSDYVGVVVLILAGAAFVGLRSNTKRADIWFWTITVFITVLWSLGQYTPFYKLPYYLIPGTKYFRAPATIFFVGTMGIAVLVAAGAEKLLRGEVGKKYLLGWLIFGVLVAILAVSGGLTNLAQSIAPENGGEYTIGRIIENGPALTVGAFRSLVFVLLAVGVGFLALSRRLTPMMAAVALVVLTGADLWSIEREYWFFSPPAKQLYATDPALEYLRTQPQPVRVLALAMNGGDHAKYSGSGLMVHDIRNVLGYHGNQIRWYNDLLAARDPNQSIQRILSSLNVRQLTNTQFILTDSDTLAKLVPGLTLAFGPVKDAQGEDSYVYRLGGDAPFAWVAPVIVKAPDEATFSTIVDPRFDVTRAAIFDTAAAVTAAPPVKELPPATGVTVHVDSYAPGKISMTLAQPAPAGSALLASENYYPGWLASVDGKPAKIGRAQFALIGVELPAGARHVELTFTSPAYETGKLITWIALIISVLLIGAGFAADRRTTTPAAGAPTVE